MSHICISKSIRTSTHDLCSRSSRFVNHARNFTTILAARSRADRSRPLMPAELGKISNWRCHALHKGRTGRLSVRRVWGHPRCAIFIQCTRYHDEQSCGDERRSHKKPRRNGGSTVEPNDIRSYCSSSSSSSSFRCEMFSAQGRRERANIVADLVLLKGLRDECSLCRGDLTLAMNFRFEFADLHPGCGIQ